MKQQDFAALAAQELQSYTRQPGSAGGSGNALKRLSQTGRRSLFFLL